MDIKLEITSLHWSHVRKFNWENFHERKLVALYWTLAFSQKGPINSCLSTYASRRLCVRLFKISDAWKLLISFFFLHLAQWYLLRIKKTCRNRILKKMLFCPKMGKMGSKWTANDVFCIFWKILLFFLEIILNEKSYCYLYFTRNSLSGKILVSELCAKISQSDSGKFNISRKKWGIKYVDTIVFDGCGQASQRMQNNKFAIS